MKRILERAFWIRQGARSNAMAASLQRLLPIEVPVRVSHGWQSLVCGRYCFNRVLNIHLAKAGALFPGGLHRQHKRTAEPVSHAIEQQIGDDVAMRSRSATRRPLQGNFYALLLLYNIHTASTRSRLRLHCRLAWKTSCPSILPLILLASLFLLLLFVYKHFDFLA